MTLQFRSVKLFEIVFNITIGSNPSELYGRATWKIEKFSQINTREIRSNVFEVGDYKW